MVDTITSFGIIGLGIIGGNLGKQAVEKGLHVVGYKCSQWPEHLKQSGIENAGSYEGFRDKLTSPRVVFIYIPTGKAVDKVLNSLQKS
jgi:6-phosphogluconate dehydrogenase